MGRYSSLIRKLVDATAEAEYKGEDISQMLKGRCFNDTDCVRQTLMNAVCDPRFRLKASIVGYWKDEARNALNGLAEQLEEMEYRSAENVFFMLEEFLNTWLRMTFPGYDKNRVLNKLFGKPTSAEEIKNVDAALDYLEEIEEAEKKSDNVRENESKEPMTASAAADDDDEEKVKHVPSQFKNRLIVGKTRKPTNSINVQQIEESFLEKIPLSLIRLARLIGRMGNNVGSNKSRFMKAGRSDIEGVTIGNDINALLPSELSLLAELKTQNVFYRKFASHHLQLFASASTSNISKKHHDGPVIICVDASSSMAGEPIKVARALAIAVCIIAWRRERDVIVVKYSDTHSCMNIGHDRSKLHELSTFLAHIPNAGNDENSMFRWLFNDIKPSMEEYAAADVLCISDFGWTSLSKETKDIIKAQKDKGMFFYGLNVNSGNPNASTYISGLSNNKTIISIAPEDYDDLCPDPPEPMDICDSVWVYENGECKEVKKAKK